MTSHNTLARGMRSLHVRGRRRFTSRPKRSAFSDQTARRNDDLDEGCYID
jgi:hypothetical protein